MIITHSGVTITVTPIINNKRQTGTRYAWQIGEHKRQAFSEACAKNLIDQMQADLAKDASRPAPVAVLPNFDRNHAALRGDTDLSSPEVFG